MHSPIVAVGIDDRTAQLLTTEGYLVETPSYSARSLFERMTSAPADALILGTRTDLDGEFVECLRQSRVETPAIRIIPGPRNSHWSHECAHFLDCGGDDALVGPPNPQEVALSLRTIFKRVRSDRIERFVSAGNCFEVNLTKRRAFLNNEPFPATQHETEILLILAAAQSAVTRDTFSEMLHGTERRPDDGNTLEVLICRLRKRLGVAALLLETRWGVGYELVGRVH